VPKVELNNEKQLSYTDFCDAVSKSSRGGGLVERLKLFEEKHRMSSPIFYEKYRKGELPDKHEFSVWAATFRVYSCLQAYGDEFP